MRFFKLRRVMLKLESSVHKVLRLIELYKRLITLIFWIAFLFYRFSIIVTRKRRLFRGFLFWRRFIVRTCILHQYFRLSHLLLFKELISTLNYRCALLFQLIWSIKICIPRISSCSLFIHFSLCINIICTSLLFNIHLLSLNHICRLFYISRHIFTSLFIREIVKPFILLVFYRAHLSTRKYMFWASGLARRVFINLLLELADFLSLLLFVFKLL